MLFFFAFCFYHTILHFFLLNEIDIICQVPFNGDEDPYKMGRLRWLDSTLGVDEEVTKPFTNLTVTGTELSHRYFVNSRTLIGYMHRPPLKEGPRTAISGPRELVGSYPIYADVRKILSPASASTPGGGLTIGVVNKVVEIGADGLPTQATVNARKLRLGKNTTVPFKVFDDRAAKATATTAADSNASPASAGSPVSFAAILSSGAAVQLKLTQPAKLLTHTSATATWQSVLQGGGLTITVNGLMDYDSYLEYSVVVAATADVTLSDIVLTVQPANDTAQMMCGMGPDGSFLHDITWTWDQG